MRFLPVPTLDGLMAKYETTFGDYNAFATETKRRTLPTNIMLQGDDRPAVNVTWADAVAFCEWLTQKERESGQLGSQQHYRLPTDLEWSVAAGLTDEKGATPKERNGKAPGSYGWPNAEVPPEGADNFAGEGDAESEDQVIHGYRDGYTHTAPVGKFAPNALGLHDMAGNVAEWVEDWFDEAKTEHTTRGGAWKQFAEHELLTSFRWHLKPDDAQFSMKSSSWMAVGLKSLHSPTAHF
jgi:formylglycine-generating enzyme required for sulfatase activity